MRSYSSGYNEIVYRTDIESFNNAGEISKDSEFNAEYYTDDSYKSIKRYIYNISEALELGYDHGDDFSIIGLNSYPCNKGMILTLNKTSQTGIFETSFLSLGYAFSHPLMCNVAPFNSHDHFDNSSSNNTEAPKSKRIPSHSFEWMITRSTHNNDLKGLRSMRNIEMSLSRTEIISNFNKLTIQRDSLNFRHGYNLAKEGVSD